MEVHTLTKEGRRVWLHLSVIVIPHEPGPLKAHVLHDVSDQRQATDIVAQLASMLHVDGAAPGRGRGQLGRLGQSEGAAGLLPGADTLTTRERDVLRFMAEGLSNRAIASQLRVSVSTVSNHVQHILTKFGAHTPAMYASAET